MNYTRVISIRLCLVIAILGSMSFSQIGAARDWSTGFPLKFVKGDVIMPYRLYLPANYSPSGKYPVVIFLHGSGERGTDNSSQVRFHIGGLIDRTESDFPAILIAPQLAAGEYWYNSPADLTMDILQYVVSNFAADVRRIYCTGLSMGGFGTTLNTRAYPHLFAAIAPLSGAYLPDPLPVTSPLRTLPTWLFHGDNDSAVTVDYSRFYYRYSTGVDPIVYNRTYYGFTSAESGSIRYTEMGGWGHNIWNHIYNNSNTDFYTWMFAQQRQDGKVEVSISKSGSNLIVQATSNMPFAQADLRGAPNLNASMVDWPILQTLRFDANGAVTFTVPMPPGAERYFYGVTSPQE